MVTLLFGALVPNSTHLKRQNERRGERHSRQKRSGRILIHQRDGAGIPRVIGQRGTASTVCRKASGQGHKVRILCRYPHPTVVDVSIMDQMRTIREAYEGQQVAVVSVAPVLVFWLIVT
jgi:hypothetical protein